MEIMTHSSWFSNVIIYCDNLSLYYVFSVAISLLAVLLTWWFYRLDDTNTQDGQTQELPSFPEKSNCGLLTQLKLARQKAILEELSAGLTEQQLQQEKETEQAQLAAIFQLLSEQREKFQVGSMEELQSQLRLYRN